MEDQSMHRDQEVRKSMLCLGEWSRKQSMTGAVNTFVSLKPLGSIYERTAFPASRRRGTEGWVLPPAEGKPSEGGEAHLPEIVLILAACSRH